MPAKTFALHSRVVVHGLEADPSLTGKIGYIRSKPKKSGRQKVCIEFTGQVVVLHPSHLKPCALSMKVLVQKAQYYIAANVRMISACDEDQMSSDVSSIEKVGFRRSKRSSEMKGTEGGACTSALLKVLYDYQNSNSNEDISFAKIVTEMRKTLASRGYQQIPQLSSSRPMRVTTPFQLVPNKLSGTRRALVVGVRYKGKPWELPGTHNDCYNMMKYLKVFHGFTDEDCTILMDDDKHVVPTRVNMLRAFRKFAFECKPGDAVYFHFAGHGGTVPDESGDEDALKKPFPLESHVVMCGLKRNAQLNGKTGTVKSRLSKGRQHVFINGLSRSFGLKPSNMQLAISRT
jgi:hypothetical protein